MRLCQTSWFLIYELQPDVMDSQRELQVESRAGLCKAYQSLSRGSWRDICQVCTYVKVPNGDCSPVIVLEIAGLDW